ncbi:hypothetical protein V2J09_000562 [Rumex salicifolius]
MERLIKGLADVVLGDHSENDSQESREERSRSTWAQVVSGEPEGEEDQRRDGSSPGRGQISHGFDPNEDQWNRTAVHQSYGKGEAGKQHDYNYNRKEESEESNDGWQTAHKKHPKRSEKYEMVSSTFRFVCKVHMDHWNAYKLPPSEQEYSKEVDDSDRIEPCEEELLDLSRACEKLWELDINRLVPGQDYEIDCGEGKKVYNKDDMAEGCLFTWVRDDVLRRPTISRFLALLDNYNPHEGYKEVITREEKQEQVAFVEEISRTAPIKYLYKYLSQKRAFSGDYHEFKQMMVDLWFGLYGRGGTCGSSSAFEHVFVGEIKSRGEEQVSGFHNWIQFYLEEAKGRVNYQGYILPRRRGKQHPDSETQLLTIQFEWNGVLKSVSSSFVGVSPEFEVALYTLCFFLGEEDNRVQLGPYSVNIKCYRLGNKIGSVFPIAET